MKNQELLLSIGLIFKNEIRCLERCLKSFLPLKETFPGQIEIIMADTGSDDGSRAVAEKYADIVFDFPWVNDFSAARNAVMDRSSGEWFLTVDADEWLDEDISQLCAFLRVCREAPGNLCTLVIRNYATADLDWNNVEFFAVRMVRLSTGVRYEGAIHEGFAIPEEKKSYNTLDKVLLHHDGYICLNDGSEEGRQKQARNLALIEQELEKTPDNMRLLMQRIDCYGSEPAKKLDLVRQALPGIQEHWDNWSLGGVHILRHGAQAAYALGLDASEWVDRAEEIFPQSIFTRTDIQYYAAQCAWRDMDCAETIRRGEQYLQGLRDYRSRNFDHDDLATGTLQMIQPHTETNLRPCIAAAYLYDGQPEKALETLEGLDYDTMSSPQVGMVLTALLRIHAFSEIDTEPFLQGLWEKIGRPSPDKAWARERRTNFVAVGARYFARQYREEEAAHMAEITAKYTFDQNLMMAKEWDILNGLTGYRHAYTLFLPLMGKCPLGTAAAMLDSDDPGEIAKLLSGMEHTQELPVSVFSYALERGVEFPLPNSRIGMEEMDSLAGRLLRSEEQAIQRVVEININLVGGDTQALCWARGLVLAAVQVFPWAAQDADETQGATLARLFAKMEKAFLPRCYAQETLNKECLFMLPPMHRFGWYCTQAFDALDSGNAAEYVRLLREGLIACEGVKDMVEFLTEHTPELKVPTDELNMLAEQIRVMLAKFSPGDPAVVALKQSEAYRKVAHLIEGIEVPIVGGLPQ